MVALGHQGTHFSGLLTLVHSVSSKFSLQTCPLPPRSHLFQFSTMPKYDQLFNLWDLSRNHSEMLWTAAHDTNTPLSSEAYQVGVGHTDTLG